MFESVHYVSSGKFISRGEWIHPDRCIQSHEILFVIEGEVFIHEKGIEYALHKNDMLLLEPLVRHYGYRPSRNTSFYWVHWTSDTFRPNRKSLSVENPYHLSVLFNQLLHYATDMRYPETLDYLTRLILAEVYRLDGDPLESRMVHSMTEWIQANSDRLLKASDVAEHFGYNADYLSRLFTKHYQKSLKQYIDQVKIQYIKTQLLNTNATLKEVAAACGFTEYAYFLKYFKYHAHVTPTDFCNTYSKSHINHK